MYRYFLATRYLLSRPINLLGMLGISLGVWALIVVVSIFSGYLNEIRSHLQSTTADLTATLLPENAGFAKYAHKLSADPNVKFCAPRLLWYGLLHPAGKPSAEPQETASTSLLGEDNSFVTVIGIDAKQEVKVTGFRSWLDAVVQLDYKVLSPEHPFARSEGIPSIVLSQSRMTRAGLRTGDKVRLTTARLQGKSRSQALDPTKNIFVVAGAYTTEYSFFDDLTVFVDIEHLRSILNTPTHDQVSEVIMRVHDKSRDRDTAERLDRGLDSFTEGFTLTRVRTSEDLNKTMLGAVDHQRGLMKIVLLVIMVVAGFLMYATLSMMVTEKTYDIGILTAMGASPRGVMTVFLACGFAITLAGVALGVLGGCLSAVYLDGFNTWLKQAFDVDLFPARVYHLKHVPYDLDAFWILQVAGIGLLLGLFVAGLPAWRAARHDPLHSLREE